MTRKLTLFIVCAFEIALILFVAAWTAWAQHKAITKEEANRLKVAEIMRGGVGVSCNLVFYGLPEKLAFFQISKNRKFVSEIYFESGRIQDGKLEDARALPKNIYWGSYRLHRQTLQLYDSEYINALRSDGACRAMTIQQLRLEAEAYLQKLIKGNKI